MWDDRRLLALNEKYEKLTPEERVEEIYNDFMLDEILVTSSFAANSSYFLYLFSKVSRNKQKIHFIDTTYHFSETLSYKQTLSEKYKLSVVSIKPDLDQNTSSTNNQLWKSNPDLCCKINKVDPITALLPKYSVWVSGLIRYQNEHRKGLRVFEYKEGILRFYPIIDLSQEDRNEYIKKLDSPQHPLVSEGYGSIGCVHCTQKGDGREGRWVGLAKTECGLHI